MSDNENEKRETSADIADEIRRAVESMGDELPYTVSAGTMRRVADRIEAAWKREREELDKRISDLEAYAKLWTGRADELRLKCDEFYAKAKPFGNAAAMREALVKCREIALQWQADEADGVAGTTDKPSARSAAEAVIDMEFEINAALSAPARNCDVGTAEEQSNRMRKFCAKQKRDGIINCGYCPIKHQYQRDCTLAWAQMPYEVKEGGAE